MIPFGQHAAAAFFAIAVVAPPAWMVLDRDPPFTRDSGQILPADPADCGLPANSSRGISPGSCVAVEWKIKTVRTCRPLSQDSTTRKIRDAENVTWELAPVRTMLGNADPTHRGLVRNFIMPSSAAIGPATYHASACFTCNPLHVLLPVCVDKPDIRFQIEKSP